MIRREMEAWSRWASPDSVSAVAQVAIDAMYAWPMRMWANREFADLTPLPSPSLHNWPTHWTHAAALAAAEIAIPCREHGKRKWEVVVMLDGCGVSRGELSGLTISEARDAVVGGFDDDAGDCQTTGCYSADGPSACLL
jgi:hypothetical protein